MNTSLKKLAILSVIVAGGLGLYTCDREAEKVKGTRTNKVIEKTEFREVLKYIKKHPQKQERIINYTVDGREQRNLQFSRRTVDNLASLVREEVKTGPEEMKDYVLDITKIGLSSDYRKEILGQLTKEERWEITKETIESELNKYWQETKEVSKDAYKKFREMKLYDKLEKIGKDARKKIYEKIQELKEND